MVGELDGIVVREMPARAKYGTCKIGGSTPVILHRDVIGGDGGDDGDVAGGVRFVTNGNQFVVDKGVAVGRIKEGTRAGGCSTARKDIRNSAFKVAAGRILGHAVRSVRKAGRDGAWATPRCEVAGSATGSKHFLMRRWDTDFNAVVYCVSAGMTVRVEASSGCFTDVIRVVTGQQSEGGNGRADGSGKIGWGSEVGGWKFVVECPGGSSGGERVSCWYTVVHLVR